MGTDNLFHKRKAKSAKGLQRRAAKRDAYAKVLIVCEGEKLSLTTSMVLEITTGSIRPT